MIAGYLGADEHCILIWRSGELWVFDFFEAFVADLGEPALEEFCLGGVGVEGHGEESEK